MHFINFLLIVGFLSPIACFAKSALGEKTEQNGVVYYTVDKKWVATSKVELGNMILLQAAVSYRDVWTSAQEAADISRKTLAALCNEIERGQNTAPTCLDTGQLFRGRTSSVTCSMICTR